MQRSLFVQADNFIESNFPAILRRCKVIHIITFTVLPSLVNLSYIFTTFMLQWKYRYFLGFV